jgi:serine/threonine protein kinase
MAGKNSGNDQMIGKDLNKDTTTTSEKRFQVLKTLGVGACGRVLHVRDTQRGNEEVALKILENSNAFDVHTRERFVKEILIGININHKNIVKAYEIVNYEGKDAYTMELVRGSDIGAIFQSERKVNFSYAEIDKIMIQLLEGLSEIHRLKIVHRDIKLENIMLTSEGIVKLNDLGLARVLRDDPMTDPGLLLGTAQYLPPEYINNKELDERSDLYACGIILWELLKGERRFSDNNAERIIRELAKTNFSHPKIERPLIPKKYNLILRAALAVEPKERFQTADEMREAIEDPERSSRLKSYGTKPGAKIYILLAATILISSLVSFIIVRLFLK